MSLKRIGEELVKRQQHKKKPALKVAVRGKV